MSKRKKHKQSHINKAPLLNSLLSRMPITGYMKFSLDSADDEELFQQTVECTGDFADLVRRGHILGSPHYYKFTVTLCNYSGTVLSEDDYYIPQMIDHYAFEQLIRELVNEQAEEFGHRKILSGKHSTIQLSVYNPNTKEHL